MNLTKRIYQFKYEIQYLESTPLQATGQYDAETCIFQHIFETYLLYVSIVNKNRRNIYHLDSKIRYSDSIPLKNSSTVER